MCFESTCLRIFVKQMSNQLVEVSVCVALYCTATDRQPKHRKYSKPDQNQKYDYWFLKNQVNFKDLNLNRLLIALTYTI